MFLYLPLSSSIRAEFASCSGSFDPVSLNEFMFLLSLYNSFRGVKNFEGFVYLPRRSEEKRVETTATDFSRHMHQQKELLPTLLKISFVSCLTLPMQYISLSARFAQRLVLVGSGSQVNVASQTMFETNAAQS